MWALVLSHGSLIYIYIYINGDDWGDGKHGIVKFPHQRGN